MKNVLRWLGIVLIVTLVGLAAFAWSNIRNTEKRLATVYEVTPVPLDIPVDSASLARGEHLSRVLCADCHGPQYAGRDFFSDPTLATVYSSNLTKGTGGVGDHYSVQDWVRAIRDGIGPKGRPLFIMPSREFHHLSARDLGAIVAYMHTLDPVDRVPGENVYHPVGKLLVNLGAFGDVINAETLDHEAPYPPDPTHDGSAEEGRYLVDITGCRTCHGEQLNGGKDPDPAAPRGPNLTSEGHIRDWTAEDFIRTLRTGITPEGQQLLAKYMPWQSYGQYNDRELTAIYNYLLSLERLPTTEP
ncbi:MAG: cytochrome c [Flavobacteriales bacterium]|nr:cytochrome c [Flavobacteriales bacterium]